MKKIVSLSVIAAGLMILVNCSPKTTKTATTAGQTSGSSGSSSSAPQTPDPVRTSSSGSVPVVEATKPWENKSDEEVLTMFKGIGPERESMGKQLYESNCKKCHELHAPNSRKDLQWVKIMEKMGPKANLGDSHYMMVASYLVKNAKQ